MDLSLLPALAAYALVMSATPGPNNLMLLASGVNFGVRRTLPHMLGISIGFMLMAIPVGLGLGALFLAMPGLRLGFKIMAAAYMVYLAWRIASASVVGEAKAPPRPLRFWEAAGFQFVNPKAIVMAITAMTAYAGGDHMVMGVLIVAAFFALVNFPSVSIWAMFGAGLRKWLSNPVRLRIFNFTMAAGLLLSLWPMVRM